MGRNCDGPKCQVKISRSHVLAVKALVRLHICTRSSEPRHTNEIACAGSEGDLCTIYVNSACCGESAPTTTAHLCNHLCVVSMCQKC